MLFGTEKSKKMRKGLDTRSLKRTKSPSVKTHFKLKKVIKLVDKDKLEFVEEVLKEIERLYPEEFGVVVLNKNKKLKNKKIKELMDSVKDPILQNDIKNITEDFSVIDSENV